MATRWDAFRKARRLAAKQLGMDSLWRAGAGPRRSSDSGAIDGVLRRTGWEPPRGLRRPPAYWSAPAGPTVRATRTRSAET